MLLNRSSVLALLLAATTFAGSVLVLTSCRRGSAMTGQRRVLVLGIDGFDPLIAERLMEQGKLPNFSRLKERGGFEKLATSVPPLSPVAWSNFITGMNPGGHGIFDFIHRDPKTLTPYLSTSRVEPPKRTIRLGSWIFPLSSGKVELLRRGKAFWELLADKGIPAVVNGIPANFPPVESEALSLSGMGTPDIQGTYGTFSFFTDSPPPNADEISGGQVFPVAVVNHQVEAALQGPNNSFRAGGGAATVDFTVSVDPESPVAKISIQGKELILKEREWSDWVRVEFKIVPLLKSVTGICRFYLKEVHPHFKLYVTPINLDPVAPALPISTPPGYARKLSREVGLFYTQGMPEDTKALNGGVFNEADFLTQAQIVLHERLAMLQDELQRFRSGLLFFYISTTDPMGHMLWAAMDENHPGHGVSEDAKYGGAIENLYQQIDRVLGTVLGKIDDKTTLIVMSDHGFAPFYRYFNLNTWLKENGYLVLQGAPGPEIDSIFQSADWKQTRAYGLGLNGLYINLYGRERAGSVAPSEKEKLEDEIIQKLLAVRDPLNGNRVIARVYKASEVYSGNYVGRAPDLIIGYNRSYRISSKSALGELQKEALGNNMEKWSGDHAMAAELVPGVLFTNRKIKVSNPSLTDLTVTILAEFGIKPEKGMMGRPIFN